MPIGPRPTGIVRDELLYTRETAPSSKALAQTAPSATTSPRGFLATLVRATARAVRGSICQTVLLPSLASHTAPAPTAIAVGRVAPYPRASTRVPSLLILAIVESPNAAHTPSAPTAIAPFGVQ